MESGTSRQAQPDHAFPTQSIQAPQPDPLSRVSSIHTVSNANRSPSPVSQYEESSASTGHHTPSHQAPSSDITQNGSHLSQPSRPIKPLSQNPSANSRAWRSTWWWWWELGAAILSMGTMCAIIVILSQYQDKPLRSWAMSIQINSVISVLTTVGKTAMLVAVAESISQLKWLHFNHQTQPLSRFQDFDDASRGPWGAATLLWSTNIKAILASLGAIITIIGLGIEPSAQQILAFPLRNTTLHNMTASLGQANAYASVSFVEGSQTGVIVPSRNLLKLQSAIINGIAGTVARPQFDCPSVASSCQWKNVTTMGICSTCVEVTDYKVNCKQIGQGWTAWCDYTSPEIQDVYDTRPNNAEDISIVRMVYDPQLSETSNHSMVFSSFLSDEFRGIVTIKTKDETIHTQTNGSIVTPAIEMHHCTWDWCARTYEQVNGIPGSVELGAYEAERVAEDDNRSNGSWATYVSASGFSFSVAKNTGDSMWGFFTNMLNTTLYKQDARTSNVQGETLDFGSYLYATEDLTQLAANMSDTMTSQIQSQNLDNPGAILVDGDVIITETYIHVRWPWLILPLLETVLATFLLLVSMFISRGGPLWKSSAIAPLVHGLEGWKDSELAVAGHESKGALSRFAKGMDASLDINDQGRLKLLRQ